MTQQPGDREPYETPITPLRSSRPPAQLPDPAPPKPQPRMTGPQLRRAWNVGVILVFGMPLLYILATGGGNGMMAWVWGLMLVLLLVLPRYFKWSFGRTKRQFDRYFPPRQ
jgi:hypothetical protein